MRVVVLTENVEILYYDLNSLVVVNITLFYYFLPFTIGSQSLQGENKKYDMINPVTYSTLLYCFRLC